MAIFVPGAGRSPGDRRDRSSSTVDPSGNGDLNGDELAVPHGSYSLGENSTASSR
jgi:hypothetical protein